MSQRAGVIVIGGCANAIKQPAKLAKEAESAWRAASGFPSSGSARMRQAQSWRKDFGGD
jgi:hypothetical protein